ncbi:Crp/Fnr family transcriptional regulator [Rubripirellula reticaptiva]|uniref:Crp/Fnr family transcriptional regulator n=1 Tax=Rubripirellula reticaptiva TaxID=2528013 RepID=UPI00164935E8|nr:cyclic nucleotide-binding domain-containing protein [Rubripirellula reticaptiva]
MTPSRLRDVQLGCDLPEVDQQTIANHGRLIRLAEGETVFREGERHSWVYWIVDGSVALEMTTGGTAPMSLLTLGRADLLAWSTMLGNRRMISTATATSPVELLAFDANELRELCQSNHEIGYQIMTHVAKQLASRLLATRLQLLDLFSHPSECDQ